MRVAYRNNPAGPSWPAAGRGHRWYGHRSALVDRAVLDRLLAESLLDPAGDVDAVLSTPTGAVTVTTPHAITVLSPTAGGLYDVGVLNLDLILLETR